MDELMKIYNINNPRKPIYHLGCDYRLSTINGKSKWCMGSSTHVKEAIKTFDKLIGTYLNQGKNVEANYVLLSYSSKEYKVRVTKGFHPELGDSKLLDESGHTLYMKIIGICQLLYRVGRADIQYSVCKQFEV